MQRDDDLAHIEAAPRRRYVRFAGVAVVLLALLPLTWGLRAWRVAVVADSARERQEEAVEEALAYVVEDFRALQNDLLAWARELAEAPVVVRGLRERLRAGRTIGPEALVDYFAALEPERRTSAELYDLTPSLAAWNGFSMPLDAAPASMQFLEEVQVVVVEDEGQRRALAVWVPVREGSRVLGGVRVMRLVEFDAPVENRYLRDFGLAERWARAVELPVRLEFGAALPPGRPPAGSRLLEGLDGRLLGRVAVEPPPVAQLLAATQERFDHVMAFWTTLLMGWLLAGLWGWYRGAVDAMGRRPSTSGLMRALGRFGLFAFAWGGARVALIAIDVPARWQRAKTPLAPLFDPTHFASTLGGGLLRSTGDFLVTALFLLLFAAALIDLAARFRARARGAHRLHDRLWTRAAGHGSGLLARLVALATVLLILGVIGLLAVVTRHVVLDSTLDYFAREGLLPEPLVLIIFCTLLIVTISVLLVGIALVWIGAWVVLRHARLAPNRSARWIELVAVVVVPLGAVYALFDAERVLPWPAAAAFLSAIVCIGLFGMLRRASWLELLILRSVLPAFFLLTLLVYPLLYQGMEAQRQVQMEDAAELFSEGRDPRVLFAIDRVLRELRDESAVRQVVEADTTSTQASLRLDSLAVGVLRGSLLSSLAAYDVSLTIFDTTGRPIGRYYDTGQRLDQTALDVFDAVEFDILRQMYAERGQAGPMVEQVTGRRDPARFQYEGIVPVRLEGDTRGWVMVRAEPQTLQRDGGTPFPRVLLPAGVYDDLYGDLSIAEFRDGVLVRSIGRDFGRYRIGEEVQQILPTQAEVWRTERVEERTYRTYYRRQEMLAPRGVAAILPATSMTVTAVRVPSINTFDHLYYLLRLTVASLFLGIPLYLFGLYLRWRAGLVPAPRVRFRDKVLNAFLTVGIITVAAVGFVGLRVVTGENERAIQSWLRQHLERVEETLALEARADEMPYRVIDRTRIDSLAARVGLDLNVFEGWELAELSRPQLVRERLIDRRLPIEAFKALYFDGYRFTYTDEEVGTFEYTAGFQALPDEQGLPGYILSVPTLPEQERIEEERARTVAYLFGALLLLVLVVMLTASLLANALARPIARLRSGLQAVAQGRFERMLPVDSRDEIGELVQTFNEMQEQLAESRRKLAQQERQLAWREMARQVAHEIKNPLTPMKLSVQHLRRAFGDEASDVPRRERFADLFERITGTLVEQIDALARIANEFHSFARMPSRVMERLDLNAVVREAVALMREESDVEFEIDLHPEPLVVEADREELRRNYINLLKNALQAIPEDRSGRITVTTAPDDDRDEAEPWAYSAVTDDGTGIPEELREKIFDPNFSTKTSGAGLGLAIVRKSVEELRGRIGFSTEEGEGTTFWIRLPLAEE